MVDEDGDVPYDYEGLHTAITSSTNRAEAQTSSMYYLMQEYERIVDMLDAVILRTLMLTSSVISVFWMPASPAITSLLLTTSSWVTTPTHRKNMKMLTPSLSWMSMLSC